jgi:hypothetical protein
MAEGRAFLDQLPVSDADRERIAHGNGEHLFGLCSEGKNICCGSSQEL